MPLQGRHPAWRRKRQLPGISSMALKKISALKESLSNFQPGIVLAYMLAIGVAIIAAAIMVKTNGHVEAALAFVIVLTIVFVTFYKVEWGFYMFFGMVLLFDQYLNVMPFGMPITYRIGYFENLKQNPLLPHFSAGVMNPLELQIAMILLAWFIAISSRRNRSLMGVPSWGFALLLLVTMIAAEVHGLHGGGNLLKSLWEIRALFYFMILFFLVPQIIQTKQQIGVLIWIFIVMITIKALQGDIRLARLGFKFGDYTVLTNHEDPMFMADIFILLIGLALFGSQAKQRKAVLWLLPVLMMGFYAGQRRACYAGFFIALGMFVVLLAPKERLKFFRRALPVFLFLVAYTAVFWNYHGRLAEPIRLVKSGFSKSEKGAGQRFDSNLYREFERYDLAATVKDHTLFGTGFGKRFQRPIPLISLGFALQDWIPHDQIYWVMVNMGIIGFFIFFLFMNSMEFEAGHVASIVKDPFLKAVAFMIATMIVNQIVVSYFDMQLTFYRDMVVLGTFCGLLPVIKSLNKKGSANDTPKPSSKPKRVGNREEVPV